MAHMINRQKYLDAIQDLSRVPQHLIDKWWREGWILRTETGTCWAAGRPYSIPVNTLHVLYREYIFYTVEPVGLYNSKNLGKVEDSESRDYDS